MRLSNGTAIALTTSGDGKREETMRYKSTLHASFGELVALLYERYLDLYDDEKLASLAVTSTVNELLELDQRGARRLLA